MLDSLHTSLYFGSYGLNLRTKSLCSMKNRAPPVLWTPLHVLHKKKGLFDCMITSSAISQRNKPDKRLTHFIIKGKLMPASVLTPARQLDGPLPDKAEASGCKLLL